MGTVAGFTLLKEDFIKPMSFVVAETILKY
jgi:hypothetical protein